MCNGSKLTATRCTIEDIMKIMDKEESEAFLMDWVNYKQFHLDSESAIKHFHVILYRRNLKVDWEIIRKRFES